MKYAAARLVSLLMFSLLLAVTADSLGNVTIATDTTKVNSDGEALTQGPTTEITVVGTDGEVTPYVNNVPQRSVGAVNPIRVTLSNEGRNTITVAYIDSAGKPAWSNSVIVELDTIGPKLQHAELIESPSTGTTLLINFADDDLKPTDKNAFVIGRKNKDGEFDTDVFTPQSISTDGRTIRLPFSTLPAGEYQLLVKGSGELTDLAGNRAGGSGSTGAPQTWVFSVLSGRKFGEHIEFPPFAAPKQQTIREEGFNPGDFVETRVARLYYYRDAARVAQIINRNVRSYNQAAVTLAERRAEASRDEANDATDKRREDERAAVRAAQAARIAEAKLAAAARDITAARQLQSEIDAKEIQSANIQEQLAAAEMAEEEATTARVNAQTARETLTAAENQADEKSTLADDAYYDAQVALREEGLAKTQLEAAQAGNDSTEILNAQAHLKTKMDAAAAAGNKFNAAKRSAENAQEDVQFASRERDRLLAVYEQKAKIADDVAVATGAAELKARKARIDQEVKILQKRLDRLSEFGDAAETVQNMEQSVASLRQTEIVKQEAWDQSEARETRARARQFRDEVTAAETDPDTYVAGDIESIDPVTQVSISVIGEGLIQLRGPIKGINKIRTMINQIDAPVGQIKVGIFTVQLNGEKGEQLEKAVGDAEGHIDLSRFLVNQSLNLLRRAIQTEAAMIAEQCEAQGHYQVDRDRKYLYAFFGRDFIDELYAMNSEFMLTENKVLALHSMGTVSLNRALFILALAKNDVREQIISRFLEVTKTDLADAEYDYRRSNELKPHRTEKRFPHWNRTHLPVLNKHHKEHLVFEAVHRNAQQRYHFRNFSGFFDTGFTTADTMNPMQREFIRLAQIFKARLVAEMEWKQRVLERGLIEDRSNDEDAMYKVLASVREKTYASLQEAYERMLESMRTLQSASDFMEQIKSDLDRIPSVQGIRSVAMDINALDVAVPDDNQQKALYRDFYQNQTVQEARTWLTALKNAKWLTSDQRQLIVTVAAEFDVDNGPDFTDWYAALNNLADQKQKWQRVKTTTFPEFERRILHGDTSLSELESAWNVLLSDLTRPHDLPSAPSPLVETEWGASIRTTCEQLYRDMSRFLNRRAAVDNLKRFLAETRAPLDHRKLLNHLIDEQEEKFIELVEGTRSHIAVMDHYLKRLSIALEDDFKVQFYDPGFVRVREAARARQVTLSQVERTTILTNNRAFAKVDPQATMEFDLPKRQVAIKEAFDAAKALVEDTGALINDPTFLAAFQMMGGSQQPTTVKNIVPGQSRSTDQQIMGVVPPQQQPGVPGSALQSLVPEPSIFKLETGTGFQIRPVMQPDGDSVVYDFDYMYTTNIREPVRADEKHLGRVKRHFVHTEVQTANFELREISRYQVALKVARTARGVPLLEDIPVLGAAFKPAPSAESSIQQNIIFGQTNVYATLFDLMGLRWAQQVVDLNHTSLLDSEHVVRGRQKSMRDFVFGEASKRVDEFLNISPYNWPNSYRPDFYHSQTLPSPYHPSGYFHSSGVRDPTGNDFEQLDRRPPEMQDPPYERYRRQPATPERIGPQAAPQSIQPQAALGNPASEYALEENVIEPTVQSRTVRFERSSPSSLKLSAPTETDDESTLSRRRNTPQYEDGAARRRTDSSRHILRRRESIAAEAQHVSRSSREPRSPRWQVERSMRDRSVSRVSYERTAYHQKLNAQDLRRTTPVKRARAAAPNDGISSLSSKIQGNSFQSQLAPRGVTRTISHRRSDLLPPNDTNSNHRSVWEILSHSEDKAICGKNIAGAAPKGGLMKCQ